MFKRSLRYVMKNDSDFGDQAVTFGKKHEFADFVWLPSQGKVVYRIDDRVPVNTSGNGLFDLLPFRSQLSAALAIIRSSGSSLFLKLSLSCLYMIKKNIKLSIVVRYLLNVIVHNLNSSSCIVLIKRRRKRGSEMRMGSV